MVAAMAVSEPWVTIGLPFGDMNCCRQFGIGVEHQVAFIGLPFGGMNGDHLDQLPE